MNTTSTTLMRENVEPAHQCANLLEGGNAIAKVTSENRLLRYLAYATIFIGVLIIVAFAMRRLLKGACNQPTKTISCSIHRVTVGICDVVQTIGEHVWNIVIQIVKYISNFKFVK